MMELDASHHHHHHPVNHQGAVTSIVNVTDQDVVQSQLAEMEQAVLEASRQVNEALQATAAIESMEAAINEQHGVLGQDDDEPGKKRSKSKKRKRPSSKDGKEAQLNTCLAVGCERQIRQRRLCPMHQKQKERNNGKIDLKENIKFAKGRTPTPFSKHANKYAKLKIFDKKIDEWAGGKDEGTKMLEAFNDSSYYQSRFPKQEDFKIYEQIGKNIIEFMKHLPEKSPLRRPLIKAISENVPLARLREVLPVSKQTVINSKKLPDQDNLLLTIRYKPNVTRNRKRGSLDNSGMDSQLDELPQHGGLDLGVHQSQVHHHHHHQSGVGSQLEPPQEIIQSGDIPMGVGMQVPYHQQLHHSMHHSHQQH